jgi:hypothetical protein
MTSEQETVRAQFNELRRALLQTFPAPRKKLDAPYGQGVYLIYSPQNKVLHVGRTYRGKKVLLNGYVTTWPALPRSQSNI